MGGDSMTPAMVETARALAAVWTGPPLVQHVVSHGGAAYQCDGCGAVLSEDEREECPHCDDDGGNPWPISTSCPDADTVPDLESEPNGGVLLAALKRLALRTDGGPNYQLSVSPAWSKSPGEWRVFLYSKDIDDMRWHHSDHLAHVAALAFLAVHP